ncbi:polymorphic toxin-type HINT domain-containing protein [Kallotenue papyrolyticum]|uniref:polymorphic toxin-type HINT domain-containing protein n=1 Tax=Kallotenue papyrolyticum TaxID=1325125 RepID=UPI0004B7EA0D|nr:polymorphic toxin-type HINT domain-containing protein [Kallotenue papyrolyticum]
MSLATNASGGVVRRQEFDPWGAIRSGGISQTSLNDTGQRRDGTGVLYYHARYYDPVLARFISADTIAPGSGALTLWPSDATAVPLFAQANAPGPQNPQELNRYAYVNNNPVRHTDPTGHWLESALDVAAISYDLYDISQNGLTWTSGLALAADVVSLALPVVAGGGMAVRAVAHADDVAKVVTKSDKAADAAKVIAKTGCSFSADTPVATIEGAVPIGAIEVGEQVLAYDEATGTTGSYTVTAVLVHADPVITYLTIAGEEVATTPEHPFYPRERTWVEAGSLWVGAQVRRADGSYGVVQAIRVEARPHIMYNLTVATAHTFFVGDQQWLVHNSCGKPIVVEHPSKRAARRAAEREAGMGKHGSREVLEPEEFNPGSRPPSGDPGKRQRVRSPETGRIVHHDPWGHKWPDGSTIPPHYGVDYPRSRPTTHHTYPSKHDPRKNR